MKREILIACLFCAAIAEFGCGSSSPQAVMTPEERFTRAKALYEKGDYLEAVNDFTILTLQAQGSTVAPDAQYYLGECRFARGEYDLAAFEYSVVKRSYPASPRVPDAQYKLALCYYNKSPRSSLDQQYTRKAIDEFQTFLDYYPTHPMAADAAAKIKELNDRLAKKQFETGKLYTRMEYYRAAILSFDAVIEKYHDTEYAPLAMLEKADVLNSRDRYTEARDEMTRFLSRYPNSVLRARAEGLLRTAERGIERQKSKGIPASPVSPGPAPETERPGGQGA